MIDFLSGPRINLISSDDVVQHLGNNKTSLIKNNAQNFGAALQVVLNTDDCLVASMIGFGHENDPVNLGGDSEAVT